MVSRGGGANRLQSKPNVPVQDRLVVEGEGQTGC